jgi:hypothetical protein
MFKKTMRGIALGPLILIKGRVDPPDKNEFLFLWFDA